MQRNVFLNLSLVVLVNIPVFVVLALYDSLGSIGPHLLEHGIDIKSLGQLISAYSITTPVAPLLFGLMADKYSQTLPTVIVLVLLTIGTLFVWFSNFNYWMIFVGRFLIGFSDCWFPLQMRLFTFLFDGIWLSFVMAVCTIISQLGIVVVFALFPHVAEIDVNYALGCGFGLAVLAGIAILIFDLLNRFYLKIDMKAQGGSELKLSDLFLFPATYWCLALITVFSMVPYWVLISFGPSFLIERNYTTQEAGYLISGIFIC
jgi:MFS family permease